MKQRILLLLSFLILLFTNCFSQKVHDLIAVTVSATKKADTVFGNWKFSVADYEFRDKQMLLLTFENSLSHAKVMLCDSTQKIISTFEIPDEAKKLYKDYLGYTNVICENHIYRITVINNNIHLSSLQMNEYKQRVMPCIDTLKNNLFFSNYDKDYPEFTYYSYNTAECSLHSIKTICDKEQLQGYNMEYYFLKPQDKLFVRKLADEYGVDKHRIAAIMTGLTSSIFYTPLYAPLFILNDTAYVFDHYANKIFSYDKYLNAIDSISIDYNHPKNWREWKNEIIVDSENHKTYALYQKNGFYYLKQIDLKSGKICSSYKLSNQYVERLKIKNDEVYYIYRPFESLQQQFVYKELIRPE